MRLHLSFGGPACWALVASADGTTAWASSATTVTKWALDASDPAAAVLWSSPHGLPADAPPQAAAALFEIQEGGTATAETTTAGGEPNAGDEEGIRAGIDATWVGTAADLAVRATVYTHCKRAATRAEKSLANLTGAGTDAVPGLLTGACVSKNGFNYLEAHVNADPADPRTDTIAGDVVGPGGQIAADWGLHLIDANIAMGNLVDVVGQESKAWLAKK